MRFMARNLTDHKKHNISTNEYKIWINVIGMVMVGETDAKIVNTVLMTMHETHTVVDFLHGGYNERFEKWLGTSFQSGKSFKETLRPVFEEPVTTDVSVQRFSTNSLLKLVFGLILVYAVANHIAPASTYAKDQLASVYVSSGSAEAPVCRFAAKSANVSLFRFKPRVWNIDARRFVSKDKDTTDKWIAGNMTDDIISLSQEADELRVKNQEMSVFQDLDISRQKDEKIEEMKQVWLKVAQHTDNFYQARDKSEQERMIVANSGKKYEQDARKMAEEILRNNIKQVRVNKTEKEPEPTEQPSERSEGDNRPKAKKSTRKNKTTE